MQAALQRLALRVHRRDGVFLSWAELRRIARIADTATDGQGARAFRDCVFARWPSLSGEAGPDKRRGEGTAYVNGIKARGLYGLERLRTVAGAPVHTLWQCVHCLGGAKKSGHAIDELLGGAKKSGHAIASFWSSLGPQRSR